MVWTHEVTDKENVNKSNVNIINSNKNEKYYKYAHNFKHCCTENQSCSINEQEIVCETNDAVSKENDIDNCNDNASSSMYVENVTSVPTANLNRQYINDEKPYTSEQCCENNFTEVNHKINAENVHLIQAEIHNEKAGPTDINSISSFNQDSGNISSDDSNINDAENVIIVNEVLNGDTNCDVKDCKNELDFKYNFNCKGHAKQKVSMLVHRHTL
ncbi:hypothetical protein ILUMI_13827 [Ignelater luminosus]|uniref:Uncharacterized protein n=1 Tax=Ignelater luminosus TaxID=2038154 RepID=A0A8K0GB22_IGNLU|nr:hypothetical protein ILUMI_13827 [Ignelater luminosus]